jgi:hypothetical protein
VYRLTKSTADASSSHHKALGVFEEQQRQGMNRGWAHMLAGARIDSAPRRAARGRRGKNASLVRLDRRRSDFDQAARW